MNLKNQEEFLELILKNGLSPEIQVAVLLENLDTVFDKGTIRARIVKFKLQKYMKSQDICEKTYTLLMIVSDGKAIDSIPKQEEIKDKLSLAIEYIIEHVAQRVVKGRIEEKVEATIMEKQEKYIDDVRLSVIKKEKGIENKKTKKKYNNLVHMDQRVVSKNIMKFVRPESLSEIVGQERAIKSLISKLSSPYPQHIILYGPPGVGKTTAARLALEEVKKLSFTPFDSESKFIEVDGTTLRWDPREITNPLLGSVHDPIYQGSKRDLAEIGIPEPKLGLVTDAQ